MKLTLSVARWSLSFEKTIAKVVTQLLCWLRYSSTHRKGKSSSHRMERVPLSRETVEALRTKRELRRAWEEYGDPDDKRALNRQSKLVSRLVAEDRGAHMQALEQQHRDAAARRAKADGIRRYVARADDDTLCQMADTMQGVIRMMSALGVGSQPRVGGGGGGGNRRAIQW